MGLAVAAAMRTVGSFPFIPKVGGNGFDAAARHSILTACNLRHVQETEWKSNRWAPVRASVAAGRFLFGFKTKEAPINNPDPVIVFQPMGSQNWPDMIIIYKDRALPIEFKSCQSSDQITWNSGIPRPVGVYVLNASVKAATKSKALAEMMARSAVAVAQGLPALPVPPSLPATTFFLGRHAISAQEIAILASCDLNNRIQTSAFNARLIALGSMWGYYPRAMNTDKGKYILHPDRVIREDDTVNYIEQFWLDQNAANFVVNHPGHECGNTVPLSGTSDDGAEVTTGNLGGMVDDMEALWASRG
jgi:hypothetical protein